MNTTIRLKKIASAPRRRSLSASQGIARQPRIVANETSMMPHEANCAACGPTWPPASASAVIAAGTYTVPAHNPQIEANMNNEFRMVRRRQADENRIANGRQTAHDRTMFSFFFQAV